MDRDLARRRTRPGFTRVVGDPSDSRGMVAAMRRFLTYRATLGATERGLYAFERQLRYFIEWADERSVTHPQQVTQAVLERYQRWLYHYRKKDGEPLSIASRRAKVVPLKSFFKWLTRSGEIQANPASELEYPRATRRLPMQSMTADEVERVLAQADTATPLGLRDRAIMEVLYGTGMRRMEVRNLHTDDIDADRGVVMIRQGKGRKDRLIPLGERALHWVRHYQEHSRAQLEWNPLDKTLFLGKEGLPLSSDTLTETVGWYIKQAQLGKTGSCHMFRHTMATLMLENGADIRFIQAMLGHASLTTTEIYTHVAVKQLQRVHTQTHPGALRRVRGAQAGADDSDSQPDPENAAAALLDALNAEADDDLA